MESVHFSAMVRSGRTTHFIDVKEAKNGLKYLSISETKVDGQGKKRRSCLNVSAESVDNFRQVVNEAASIIGMG